MKLLIVIVNYRTPGLTVDCLRSLEAEVARVRGARVVVTDNASPDDSVRVIGDAIAGHGWGDWASLVPLPDNGGFAYGNNAGIRPHLAGDDRPQYVYLLNPDTIALPGAAAELVDFLDANPRVGIAGGRAENLDGTVRRTVFRFPSPPGELESNLRLGIASRLLARWAIAPETPDAPAPADWVSGASMMVRRDVFDAAGMLDDGYFMYYEETDFCLRAARAGWATWYVPASRIVHLVGQSSGVTGDTRAARRRPRYWFDSRHRFFRSNYGAAKTLLADLAFAGGYAVSSTVRVLKRKPREDPPWLLWDFLRHNASLWCRGR